MLAAVTATSADLIPTNEPAREKRATRIESIDVLRGLVMILMAIDHVRDFVGPQVPFVMSDLAKIGAPLFVTRWITHFCAPVFVLLAGTSAYLQAARGKPRAELSRFLFTRGLWLIFLELTVVRFGWTFDPFYRMTPAQVIWAIGWSMIALAALVHLPARIVGIFGVLMIAGHNLLDGIKSQSFGPLAWLWKILHERGRLAIAEGHGIWIAYPLIPWIGVMALGYALGAYLEHTPDSRKTRLYRLGAALTLAFVILRAIDLYGDPHPWSSQPSALLTVLSFVNCTKYPPSLLYLLMTLGPSLIMLGWFEGRSFSPTGPLLVFGRTPLFYYLLHLPFAHVVAGLMHLSRYGTRALSFGPGNLPSDFGFSLPVVYLTTAFVVLALYPVCRSFGALKQRRRDLVWLSYL